MILQKFQTPLIAAVLYPLLPEISTVTVRNSGFASELFGFAVADANGGLVLAPATERARRNAVRAEAGAEAVGPQGPTPRADVGKAGRADAGGDAAQIAPLREAVGNAGRVDEDDPEVGEDRRLSPMSRGAACGPRMLPRVSFPVPVRPALRCSRVDGVVGRAKPGPERSETLQLLAL